MNKNTQDELILKLIANAFYNIIIENEDEATMSQKEKEVLGISSKEEIVNYIEDVFKEIPNIFNHINLENDLHKKIYDKYIELYELPQFKYNPNVYLHKTNVFSYNPSFVTCDVCNGKTAYYIDDMYGADYDEELICPKCIASGEAAKKYDGFFIDVDEDDYEEVALKTPKYISWQEEEWLFCCDEPMIYIGEVLYNEIPQEVIDRCIEEGEFDLDFLQADYCVKYLFECPKCKENKIHADMS